MIIISCQYIDRLHCKAFIILILYHNICIILVSGTNVTDAFSAAAANSDNNTDSFRRVESFKRYKGLKLYNISIIVNAMFYFRSNFVSLLCKCCTKRRSTGQLGHSTPVTLTAAEWVSLSQTTLNNLKLLCLIQLSTIELRKC